MGYMWTKVKSSNVNMIQYNDKTKELEVQFKSGATYAYYNVPPSVGNAMPYAESKGKFVWGALRDKYSYQRLS